ncbi:MAG: xanthine dehydrogenase, partial [Calditrichaeota bacterium]
EDGGVKIYSATQSASLVQKTAARVLGLATNRIEVEVPRLGGAFGGKEDQATVWACLAALAAAKTKHPVKITLPRPQDMSYTGKRHPYSSDYKIGLTKDGKIIAYEVTFYQNAGGAADLSPAILERTLFHATGSYFIPHVKATAVSCKTNLPPNTAFRGFGAPQAMFVIESALFAAAAKMGVQPQALQQKNLLRQGDEFPYGMKAEKCRAIRCWNSLHRTFDVSAIEKRIADYNRHHHLTKKGMALMPICFGISFTNIGLNQASAMVHVFSDGSVSVASGAVEMGQGVKTKIQGIASRILAIPDSRIKVEFTNTQRIANMSPTAASTGADMNGHAVRIACERLLARVTKHVAQKQLGGRVRYQDGVFRKAGSDQELSWDAAVQKANSDRISLSAHAFYATPHIYFDKSTEKGKPFAYHVYGAAVVEATVDCLRGIYRIDSVQVVHDAGKSLNPLIDLGQMEGGIVQGLGWMTMEEVVHDPHGRLLTDSLTTYKVPDIHFAPDIKVRFLPAARNPAGPFNSKAIGEPPFLYGIAGYFAILNAMRAVRPDLMTFDSPMTPEKVLMNLIGCGKAFRE